jgi:hypothetical protein
MSSKEARNQNDLAGVFSGRTTTSKVWIGVETGSHTAHNAEDSRLITERDALNCQSEEPLHGMVQGANGRSRRLCPPFTGDHSVFPGRLQSNLLLMWYGRRLQRSNSPISEAFCEFPLKRHEGYGTDWIKQVQ